MPPKQKKIKLIYFVVFTLLLIGLVPLVLTGWFLSERSAKELRAVENRYQTQLVQEKARQGLHCEHTSLHGFSMSIQQN